MTSLEKRQEGERGVGKKLTGNVPYSVIVVIESSLSVGDTKTYMLTVNRNYIQLYHTVYFFL